MRLRFGTVRLFTLAGAPVCVHWSLLVLWIGLGLGAGVLGGWRETLRQGLWWGLLFGLVLLHEMGHLAAARLLRVPVSSILLWPLGGFTAVHMPPGRFGAECFVALGGPAVHLLLALGLAGLGVPEDLRGFWGTVWQLNLLLGGFNLLPVFPLDGGRVLRGVLALGLGEGPGTRLALQMGQAGALGIGGLAVWQLARQDVGGIVTMTVAMWLWSQTLQETRRFARQDRLRRIPVATYAQPLSIAVNDRVPLPAARRLLAHSGQLVLPVESADRWAEGLLWACGGLRRERLRAVEEELSIAAAWSELAPDGAPGLLVTRGGRPIGWLAREQVETLMREGDL